jgi:hypothetical protein
MIRHQELDFCSTATLLERGLCYLNSTESLIENAYGLGRRLCNRRPGVHDPTSGSDFQSRFRLRLVLVLWCAFAILDLGRCGRLRRPDLLLIGLGGGL